MKNAESQLVWFGANTVRLANGVTVDCHVIAERLSDDVIKNVGPQDDEEVACVYGSDDNDVNAETARKMALAFNCHDELVAACQSAVDSWHGDSKNFEREIKSGTPEWLKACRAILAKVAQNQG